MQFFLSLTDLPNSFFSGTIITRSKLSYLCSIRAPIWGQRPTEAEWSRSLVSIIQAKAFINCVICGAFCHIPETQFVIYQIRIPEGSNELCKEDAWHSAWHVEDLLVPALGRLRQNDPLSSWSWDYPGQQSKNLSQINNYKRRVWMLLAMKKVRLIPWLQFSQNQRAVSTCFWDIWASLTICIS